jgi:hypothetical protein
VHPHRHGTNFVLVGDDATQLANWRQLSYPAAPVSSVAGKTGVVTLDKADVGLGNVDNVSDANKPVSTATQTALDGKEATQTAASQVEAEAGSETAIRSWSPLRIWQAIAAKLTLGTWVSAADGKATPVDADSLPLSDSAAGNVLKKLTWANLKATLKTYFDTLYPSGSGTSSGTNTGDQTSVSGNAGTATALATARSIYGNNFDGTAALAQIIASTFGGTGNGFTKFTGPATSEKTFTLPNADASLGYLGIPQNSQSANYTTVAADAGKHLYHPAADTTARTWTIDSNANVAYPIGTAITFDNDYGAGALTIAITSDTLVLVGTAGSTGSRTLASGGQATAIKVASTRWRISGTGLT